MTAPAPTTAEHMPTVEHMPPTPDSDATGPTLAQASTADAAEASKRSLGDMLPMLVGGIGAALVTVLGGVIIVLLSVLLQASADRFDKIDQQFDKIDQRFDKIDQRFAAQDNKIAEIDLKLTALIAALNMTEQVDAAVEGRLLDASGDTGSRPPPSN